MGITKETLELSAAQLSIDPRVQRIVDPRRVAHIAANWNDLYVGTITVSHRVPLEARTGLNPDAEEWIILDGQTRWHALKAVCGQDTTTCTIPADVYTGLTLPEEAAMFLSHNDRKSVTPLDTFRIALVAEEEWAVNIRNIAAKYNWAVAGTAEKGQRRFNAISAAKKIYFSDGTGETLDRTFAVIDAAWPGVAGAVCGESINGIGGLYAAHGGLDTAGFVTKLAKLGFNKFFSQVHDTYRAWPSLSLPQAAYFRTVEIYNANRRTKRIEA